MGLTLAKRLVLPCLMLAVLPACVSSGDKPAWQPPPPPPEAERTAQFLIARYAALTNDPKTSAKNYMAALRGLRAPSPELLERAIFANLLIGDVKAASRLVERYSGEQQEEAALARLIYGLEQVRLGRYQSAAVLLSTEDYGGFNELVAESVSAWATLEAEGLEAALDRLSVETEQRPLLYGLSLATRGLLQSAGGDLPQALENFAEMRRLGIRLAVVAEQEARILDHLGRGAEARIVLADFRRNAGLNPVIEGLFRSSLKKEPLGFEPLTSRQGAALAVYILAATLANRTGGDVSGVYYALALHLDPDLDVARTLWADALDKANRRPEAVELLEEIDDKSPFYATARGQMAWALHRDGEDKAAVRVARSAFEKTADRDLSIQLGDLMRSLGRHKDAEAHFTSILTRDTENGVRDWRVFYARAKERDTLGKWEGAEADLLTALQINPKQPDVSNYLGYSWIERGQNTIEALELVETAAAARPNSGEILDSLGWAHYKLGDYEEAVKHLERATELVPASVEINEHLGDAYWRVGRRLEAGFQWKRILKLGVTEEDRTRIEEKINFGLDTLGNVTLTQLSSN